MTDHELYVHKLRNIYLVAFFSAVVVAISAFGLLNEGIDLKLLELAFTAGAAVAIFSAMVLYEVGKENKRIRS